MPDEATITVEAVAEPKHGESQRGPWTKWSFKADDGNWYSTFTEGVGTRFVKGETYTIAYEDNGKGRNVKFIKSQGSNSPAIPTSSVPGFTGGEKDRSIVRQVAWKAAALIVSDIINDPEAAFLAARKIAHGIENDIYREQPKPPAPTPTASGLDESDIPFDRTIDGAN